MTGILLVSTWRHGDHVGSQGQKHFSPLGTKRYFHVNFSRKNSIVLTADPQHENLKFSSALWARGPTRVEITSPVDDFMEGFERRTQVESCDITHMWKTENNTENLEKQNNHIKKVQMKLRFINHENRRNHFSELLHHQQKYGSLSNDVFKSCTSTGSELFDSSSGAEFPPRKMLHDI